MTSTDLNWSIEGTGDLDGDGKTDILWKHATSGAVAAWLINGLTLTSGGNIAASTDLSWEIQGEASALSP